MSLNTQAAKPRLVLLDACGVVLNDPLHEVMAALAAATGQAFAAVLERYVGLRDPFWRGELSELAFWGGLGGGDGAAAWRERLLAAFAPGAGAPRLAAWAAEAPLWMLSNHRSDWLLPRLDALGLAAPFARIGVSDTLGAAKPEALAFERGLAGYGGPVGAVLFVDDKPRNLDAARALGLDTLLADAGGAWVAELDARLGCRDRVGADRP